MFSGGVDSTYMLYHYLKNTKYDIHAHHISMRYPSEPRWKQEDIASRKIMEYCKKIRPFGYTESLFAIGFKRYVGRDSDTQLLVASKVAPNLKGKVHVALGWMNDDRESEVDALRMRNNVTQKLWEAFCGSMDRPFGDNVQRKLLFPLMDMDLCKKEIVKDMPKELLDMTWSCRRPIRDKDGNIKPCGKCRPCKKMNLIKN